MKAKKYGCAFLGAPWAIMVLLGLALGEPGANIAQVMGTIFWVLPIVACIISLAGSLMHYFFGAFDSDPTPDQRYLNIRRGKSLRIALSLIVLLAGMFLSWANGDNWETTTTGMYIVIAVPMAGGFALTVVSFIDSLITDSWTHEAQQSGVE